jgi:hypothetical protein
MTATMDWLEFAARAFEPQDDEVRWETPGDLAAAIDPKTIQTAALDAVDEAIAWAYSTPNARLVISLPPQEGKSQRVTKTGSLWALTQNPELRLGIASYSQALAEGFGREVRNWIASNDGDEGTLDQRVRPPLAARRPPRRHHLRRHRLWPDRTPARRTRHRRPLRGQGTGSLRLLPRARVELVAVRRLDPTCPRRARDRDPHTLA